MTAGTTATATVTMTRSTTMMGGGTTTTKAKEDGDGCSPMRRLADDIAYEIIKALVNLIDKKGHSPVLPLTMRVSIGSKYGRHQSVVLMEHPAVVLQARLRHNNGSRFNNDTSTNGIVWQAWGRGIGTWTHDTRTRRHSGRT